jgi:predicted RNase H-like nuclease (RuvC/YqgF family)
MNLLKQIVENIFLGDNTPPTKFHIQTISKKRQKKNNLRKEIHTLKEELEQEKHTIRMLKKQVKNLNQTFFQKDFV